MGILGGSFIPVFVLDRLLGPLPKIVPHYWANRALTNVMLRGLRLADVTARARRAGGVYGCSSSPLACCGSTLTRSGCHEQASRRMLTIAWKEIQLIAQDRGALAILFLLPLLVGSMMASMNLAGGQQRPRRKRAPSCSTCAW